MALMSEINRVFAHIEGFFKSDGAGRTKELAKILKKCVERAVSGFHDRGLTDEALASRIDTAMTQIEKLEESPPSPDKCFDVFKAFAIEAMTLRRALLPLNHPDKPWKTVDPKDALFDDDDQYSFAIYDTLADEIGELLPDLHKIAVEIAWDASSEGENGAS